MRTGPGTKTANKTAGILPVLVLGAVTAAVIALLKMHTSPVRPAAPHPLPPAVPGCDRLAKLYRRQAGQADGHALELFRLDLDRIMRKHAPKLDRAAGEAAKRGATYGSCCKLISCLARDKVEKQHKTRECVEREIGPVLNPALKSLENDIGKAEQDLDANLARNTAGLAFRLAALNPAGDGPRGPAEDGIAGNPDAAKSLRNLGINAAGVGVSMTFDAVAVYRSVTLRGLFRRVVEIIARVFGRDALELAAEATVAAADGPLPVGDIIALIGVGWTAWDIHQSRKAFERDLDTALKNMVQGTRDDLGKRAVEYARALVKKHEDLQDRIDSEALRQIGAGGK